MDALINKIKSEGIVINENILKVDSFLNHQIDANLMEEVAEEFYNYYKNDNITKILTIESSGIAPAVLCGLKFNVPVVFVKKSVPSTITNAYQATVHSYTKNKSYTASVDKRFLNEEDNILFIDDFLANGEAFRGVESIIQQSKANLCAVGILIEKAYQDGHTYIVNQGYKFKALASIESMNENQINFIK